MVMRYQVRRTIRVGLMVLLAGAAACGKESADGEPASVRRDSSGVEIVINHAPAWEEPQRWPGREPPLVQIGSVDGAPQYQLAQVRGLLRLPDGRVALADFGSLQVRFYAADGTFLSSTGRQGAGPGEFQSLGYLGPYREDSLVVWDWRLRRVSIFDDSGHFGRQVILQGGAMVPALAGALGDGSVIATNSGIFGNETQSGLRRDTTFIFRHAADGAFLDTVAVLPGEETYIHVGENSVTSMQLPFGRRAFVAVADSGVYAGASDRYEIRWYSPAGELRRIIRRDVPVRPVDDSMIAVYKRKDEEAMLGNPRLDDRTREYLGQLRNEIPFPTTMPAFGDLKTDRAGNLWVQAYLAPGDTSAAPWTVFDSTGQMLGQMTLPSRFRLQSLDAGAIAGVWFDANDVEYARVYGE
ncbi:MAG: hypothetical protein AB7I33_01530 [Gemmatimonadales bacterium]